MQKNSCHEFSLSLQLAYSKIPNSLIVHWIVCSVFRLHCSMQNELWMNEEMEKIFKKGSGDLIEVFFLNFAVGNEEIERTVRCAG